MYRVYSTSAPTLIPRLTLVTGVNISADGPVHLSTDEWAELHELHSSEGGRLGSEVVPNAEVLDVMFPYSPNLFESPGTSRPSIGTGSSGMS